MSRAMNPDGTPWWVSTGPPQKNPAQESPVAAAAAAQETSQPQFQQPQAEQPSFGQPSQSAPDASSTASETTSPLDSLSGFLSGLGVTPEVTAAAAVSGLNLLTGVINLVSTPLNGPEQTSVHIVSSCGTCPLCVAVAALREHDESMADLVESALGGVTSSIEKLAGMIPHVVDSLSETLVEVVVRTVLHKGR